MKKTAALAAACLLRLSAFAGPSAEAPEAAPSGLRVAGLKGPTGIGMVRMLEGDARIGGVPVAYEMAASPDLVAAKLLTGELDLAALPTNMAAKLEPERDLQLRYLPHLELAQLAIAGREPLAVLPEPFVSKVLLQKPAFRVALDLQSDWVRAAGLATPLAMSVIVVKAETARRSPAAVRAFLARFAESTRWVNEHPREAALLVEKHGLGFSAAEAEAAIPRCNIRFVPAREAKPAVEAFLRVLLSFSPEAIGGRLPDDAFYLEE